MKDRVQSGQLDDGEGGMLRGVSLTKGVKRSAIAVQGQSEPVITENHLDGNDGYGIMICSSARPTVEANTLLNHKCSAIAIFDKAAGVLKGNILRDNTGFGIEIRSSARLTVERNVLSATVLQRFICVISPKRL